MKDHCSYLLKLHGEVSAAEVNRMSPVQITLERVEVDGTVVSLCSDQSGLVGLLSYLHGVGYLFLALQRIETAGPEKI